jgi:tRNA pseudouridine38-40 synthase
MDSATLPFVLLVTHYDGGDFAGWQRQLDRRTVQGEMERVLRGLLADQVSAVAAGRTDAGVHARGQGVGVRAGPRWEPDVLRRAMNAKLPDDIWIEQAHAMHEQFHPRFSATRRRYAYHVGTEEAARSPFRRRTEWALGRPLDAAAMRAEAQALIGEHCFRAFAVQGTAPADDDHRSHIHVAEWQERDGGLTFHVEANRFLHHMVRFLVGTMVEVGLGRRPSGTLATLLRADGNRDTSAPAPPQGLFLEQVTYPATLYLSPT